MSYLTSSPGSHPTESLTAPLLESGQSEFATEPANGVGQPMSTEQNDPSITPRPEGVIGELEKHLWKLGEFDVEDTVIIHALHGRTMMTLGKEECGELNWEELWFGELDKLRKRGAMTEAGWIEMVKVECYVLSIPYAAGPPGVGILHPIVVRWQQNAAPLSVFELRAVQAVLNYKWDTWAAEFLRYEFCMYTGWLLSFTIFVILLQGENLQDSFQRIWEGSVHGKITAVVNVMAFVCMLPFAIIDSATFQDYGFKGWLHYRNVLDICTYAMQLCCTLVYFTRWCIGSNWFLTMLAIQCIFLFGKVQYFLRVFASAKSSLVDTLKVVLSDVKWFLLFILLILFSFALAFYILYRNDTTEDSKEFKNIGQSIVAMFSFMLGGFETDVFYHAKNSEVAVVFFVLYESVMAILLLNLLIGIMTNSYAKVMEHEQLWNLCSRALIVDELEMTIPRWLMQRWNPRYVHFMQLSPHKSVTLETLRSRLDTLETAAESSSRETLQNLKEMEHRLLNRLNFLSKELEFLKEYEHSKAASERPSRSRTDADALMSLK